MPRIPKVDFAASRNSNQHIYPSIVLKSPRVQGKERMNDHSRGKTSISFHWRREAEYPYVSCEVHYNGILLCNNSIRRYFNGKSAQAYGAANQQRDYPFGESFTRVTPKLFLLLLSPCSSSQGCSDCTVNRFVVQRLQLRGQQTLSRGWEVMMDA